MKLLMVITGMQSGGAERVMATLCNELSKRHQVRLAVIKTAASDYAVSQRVEITAGNVKNKNFLASVSFVGQQMKEFQPDVVLSFMTKTNLVALCANKLYGLKKKIIIAERANPYYAGRVYKVLRRFVYPWAQGAVFQTYQAQDYYKDMLQYPTTVLRNPLNPDFAVEPYKGQRTKRIVSVGRLSEEKNHRLLIRAFAQIADEFSEHRVEIYGEGPYRKELEALIAELGMQDRVFLMGRKDQIRQHIQDAALFVLPSNSEGMPNALLEAMALGMACIATDCPIGGSAVIVQNEENGLLIPMEDEEALKAAMCRVLTDLAFAETIREKACDVAQTFNAQRVCAEWESYLTDVYGGVR